MKRINVKLATVLPLALAAAALVGKVKGGYGFAPGHL
jgi:hypothetical protein